GPVTAVPQQREELEADSDMVGRAERSRRATAPQQLVHDAELDQTLGVVAAGLNDAEIRSSGGEAAQQCGLADPSGTLDDHDARTAGVRGVHDARQLAKFAR